MAHPVDYTGKRFVLAMKLNFLLVHRDGEEPGGPLPGFVHVSYPPMTVSELTSTHLRLHIRKSPYEVVYFVGPALLVEVEVCTECILPQTKRRFETLFYREKEHIPMHRDTVSLNQEKIEEEERFDGKWVLKTNTTLTAKQVALKYKEL
jgi:hypothetical protein